MAKAGSRNMNRSIFLPRGVFLDCYNLYPGAELKISVITDDDPNSEYKTELNFQAIDENRIEIIIKDLDRDFKNSDEDAQTDSFDKKLLDSYNCRIKNEVDDEVEMTDSVLGELYTQKGAAKTGFSRLKTGKYKEEIQLGNVSQSFEDDKSVFKTMGGSIEELNEVNLDLSQTNSEQIELGVGDSSCSEATVVDYNYMLETKNNQTKKLSKTKKKKTSSKYFSKNIKMAIKLKKCAICGESVGNLYNHVNNKHSQSPKYEMYMEKIKSRKLVKIKKKAQNINVVKHKSLKCEPKSEDDKPFRCKHCPKSFRLEYSFYKHIKDLHKESETYLDNSQNTDIALECPYCHVTLMSFNSLRYHMANEHSFDENESYIHKCVLCDMVLKNVKTLLRHIEVVHDTTERKFLCHLCGFAFKRDCDRKDHVKNVHGNPGEVEFKCEVCSYITRSKKYFTDHMRRIHGPKNFMCTYCSRQFKLSRDLNRHIVFIHETHKIVKETCEVCGRQFNSKSNLNSHVRRHYKSSAKADNTNELEVVSLANLNCAT